MGTTLHGVNVDQLVGTVNAIKENPDLARFRFRAVTEWVDGGHSRTKIQKLYGAGIEDASRNSPFVLEGDEPPVLLGGNAGPNAVETVLSALASCLTVGVAYNAAARGINVESLRFTLEGDIDLQGFLGLSDRVRPRVPEHSSGVQDQKRCPAGKAWRNFGSTCSGHRPFLTSSGTRCPSP